MKSRNFAIDAHADQMYGDKPYKYHLDKVVKNAAKYSNEPAYIQAAWLHDVVEDTSVTVNDVAQQFGQDVADIVDLVSNTGNKKQTFERIRTNPGAVFVKLCDRLANVSEGEKNDKYRKEQPLFKSILYKPGEFDELWDEIDRHLKQ